MHRMTPPISARLEALEGWRSARLAQLVAVERFLAEYELDDASAAARLRALRERLGSGQRRVAFVGEFSRGKSELINALLQGEGNGRILPATPGRTTMCPVELGYEPDTAPALALLPIETRRDGATLAELRADRAAWRRVELDPGNAAHLAQALAQVAATRWAALDEARALGLWDDAHPETHPERDEQGRIEIPLWRHALVNLPHPLLERGLAVLDTPGLNALGAEPELTLAMLPDAHAVVFVLGADTGVTRSDLETWRDHLAGRGMAQFVVLNKIDTLRDPLLEPAQVAAQIEAQRRSVARILDVAADSVFAVSARDALVAGRGGHRADEAWRRSGIAQLEAALGARLLEDGRSFLQRQLDGAAAVLRAGAVHRLGERRRQVAEQTLELRGLRGKSLARLRSARERIAAEADEFEQCQVQLRALRSVHQRLLVQALAVLAGEPLRAEVDRLQHRLRLALIKFDGRAALGEFFARLRQTLAQGSARSDEIQAMLGAGCARLNADHGFALAPPPPVALDRLDADLAQVEAAYARYLGLAGALRLVQPRAMEQFKRLLLSRLRVVFETAGSEVELWSRTTLAQIDSQLGERRSAFTRRAAAIERIDSATGELEARLAELAAQDAALLRAQRRLGELLAALCDAPDQGMTPGPAAPLQRVAGH